MLSNIQFRFLLPVSLLTRRPKLKYRPINPHTVLPVASDEFTTARTEHRLWVGGVEKRVLKPKRQEVK
jgi:hypothetical protein